MPLPRHFVFVLLLQFQDGNSGKDQRLVVVSFSIRKARLQKSSVAALGYTLSPELSTQNHVPQPPVGDAVSEGTKGLTAKMMRNKQFSLSLTWVGKAARLSLQAAKIRE